MVQPVVPQKEKGAYYQAGCVEPAGGYKNPDGTRVYSYMVRTKGTDTFVFRLDGAGRDRDIDYILCPEGILGNTQTRIWG